MVVDSKTMLCAIKWGSIFCNGDSGSPLLDPNDINVGVISSGLGCAIDSYLGTPEQVVSKND